MLAAGSHLVLWALAVLAPDPPIQRPKSMAPKAPATVEPDSTDPPAPAPEPDATASQPEAGPEPGATPQPDAPTPEPEAAAPRPDAATLEPDASSSCPCDDIDWRCRQDHPDACPPEIAPEPLETERAPIEVDETPPEPSRAAFEGRRRAFFIAPGIGVAACGNDWCDGYRAGFWGQMDFGFRFGIATPVFGFGGGIGPMDTGMLGEEIGVPVDEARVSFFEGGAGVMAFPVRTGRLDPFFGVRLGFSRVQLKLRTPDGIEGTETVKRGGARFTGGLSVFVTETIQVGPRFDITVPFAGRVCTNIEFMGDSVSDCIAVRDLEEQVRVDSTELPLPWSVVVELRALIVPFRAR